MSAPANVAEPARPRWSVMVPAHECAGYLASALPAVIAELGGRDDAEIVVVDDASTDNPGAVVASVGHGRVRYEPNPRQLGAVGTFNRCIELARGEFVHILHGDDMIQPGFYAAMEQAMSHSSAVAAVCRTRYIDANGRPGPTTRSYRDGTGVWDNALAAMVISNRVRPPGVVVRRSAYQRIGGFRADLPHAADWEMWTRLAANGPVVFVDETLAFYRRHSASDTARRVRDGANIRERVAAISVVNEYIDGSRRPLTTRLALVHSAAFAGRTAVSCVRAGDMRATLSQVREAIRCVIMVPGGVPVPQRPHRYGSAESPTPSAAGSQRRP